MHEGYRPTPGEMSPAEVEAGKQNVIARMREKAQGLNSANPEQVKKIARELTFMADKLEALLVEYGVPADELEVSDDMIEEIEGDEAAAA